VRGKWARRGDGGDEGLKLVSLSPLRMMVLLKSYLNEAQSLQSSQRAPAELSDTLKIREAPAKKSLAVAGEFWYFRFAD